MSCVFPSRNERGARVLRIALAWAILALPCLHTFLHHEAEEAVGNGQPTFQSAEKHRHTDACGDHDSDCQICVERLNGPPLLTIADGLPSDVAGYSNVFHSVEIVSSHFAWSCAVPRAPPVESDNVA